MSNIDRGEQALRVDLAACYRLIALYRWDDLVWGEGTRFLGAGDFNGDGKADLALFYDYGANHVALFTMTAGTGGALGAPVLRWDDTVWGENTKFVTAGDFNGDGKTDLAVVHGIDHTVNILLNKGDGTFPPPASYPTTGITSGPVWVSVADFNGDGKLDLAIVDYGPAFQPSTVTIKRTDQE